MQLRYSKSRKLFCFYGDAKLSGLAFFVIDQRRFASSAKGQKKQQSQPGNRGQEGAQMTPADDAGWVQVTFQQDASLQ
jgi:hypothetical protein